MARKRKRGRPKGSKDSYKRSRSSKMSAMLRRVRGLDESEFRKLRGRPRKTVSSYSTASPNGNLKQIHKGTGYRIWVEKL